MKHISRKDTGFDVETVAAARKHLDLLRREVQEFHLHIKSAMDFLTTARKWLAEFEAQFDPSAAGKPNGATLATPSGSADSPTTPDWDRHNK